MSPLEAAPSQNADVEVRPLDARPKAREFDGYLTGFEHDPMFDQLLAKHDGNVAAAGQDFYKKKIREAKDSMGEGHLPPEEVNYIRQQVDALMNSERQKKNEQADGGQAMDERKKKAEALLNKWKKRK